jgi:hypothetical protein
MWFVAQVLHSCPKVGAGLRLPGPAFLHSKRWLIPGQGSFCRTTADVLQPRIAPLVPYSNRAPYTVKLVLWASRPSCRLNKLKSESIFFSSFIPIVRSVPSIFFPFVVDGSSLVESSPNCYALLAGYLHQLCAHVFPVDALTRCRNV